MAGPGTKSPPYGRLLRDYYSDMRSMDLRNTLQTIPIKMVNLIICL